MKIINSQKRNKHSYFVDLSISDYDIEALEDLVYCANNDKEKMRLNKWLKKIFKEF